MNIYKNLWKITADKNLGFTLIELLVVVTMVGIVSGVGIFSLVNYGNTQELDQGAASIKNIFDQAKFNALSSVEIDVDENGETTSCDEGLAAYRVDIVPSSTEQDNLKLYMECGSSSNLVNSYTLTSNLSFGIDTSCDEVTYEALTLNTSALPALPCVISVEGFDQERTINIDILGNINIQ